MESSLAQVRKAAPGQRYPDMHPSTAGGGRYGHIADLIWDSANPVACEASVLLHHAAKLEQLYQRSICTRIRRVVGQLLARITLAVNS